MAHALDEYVRDMKIAKFSPVTIKSKVELLTRLADYLGRDLLTADAEDLRGFQGLFTHRARATVNVYSRHLKLFYDWAENRRLLPGPNPADELVIPRVRPGQPHPTALDDLRTIFECTTGPLRLAYALAAFAGCRCGEICRLHRRDLELVRGDSWAYVHGKGDKVRKVPLLDPVVAEIQAIGGRGWLVARDGRPYPPHLLSANSSRHLRKHLEVDTTLHSMRGTFATETAKSTKDVVLVQQLLGHSSLATTQIYVKSTLSDAHERMAGVRDLAAGHLNGRGPHRSAGRDGRVLSHRHGAARGRDHLGVFREAEAGSAAAAGLVLRSMGPVAVALV